MSPQVQPRLRVLLASAASGVADTIRSVLEREGIDVRVTVSRDEAIASIEHDEREIAIAREPRTLEEIERMAIEHALERTGGHVTEAAVVLGMSRSALYRRLQYHGIPRTGGSRARSTPPPT